MGATLLQKTPSVAMAQALGKGKLNLCYPQVGLYIDDFFALHIFCGVAEKICDEFCHTCGGHGLPEKASKRMHATEDPAGNTVLGVTFTRDALLMPSTSKLREVISKTRAILLTGQS